MSVVNKYNLFYDSKYRTTGSNTQPSFNLTSPIVLSNPNHRFVAQVSSVDIPYSFKSLSAPYNVLRVNYTEVGHVNSTTIITIPEGNYSISVLLITLESLLTAFITPIAMHIPGFNFLYDRSTGRCTLTLTQLTGSNQTYIRLYWTDPNTDFLAEFFGFDGTVDTVIGYTTTGDPSNANNVSSQNVNCSPVSSIYIRSSTLTQPSNNDEALVEYASSVSDILLKVPVSTPYGTWLIFYNSDVEVQLSNQSIDVVQFYLTTLSYAPISLQGVHWKIHLIIKEIRDPFLDEIEKQQQDNAIKIQDMESQKNDLLQQLSGLSSEMRAKIQIVPIDQTAETLKKELLQEVDATRKNNLIQ